MDNAKYRFEMRRQEVIRTRPLQKVFEVIAPSTRPSGLLEAYMTVKTSIEALDLDNEDGEACSKGMAALDEIERIYKEIGL